MVEGSLPTRRRRQPRALALLRARLDLPERRLHALTWLANLAIASGAADRDDVLGDRGILHEYVHRLEARACGETWGPRLAAILAEAGRLALLVPGYLSPAERRVEIPRMARARARACR